MKKHLFLLAAILAVLSCNSSKSRFLFDVKEIDFVNKSDTTIKGTRLDMELPLGVSQLALCDSFFIVMFQYGDPFMNVYSKEWDLLGRFCYKGRAKNEFLDVPRMISRQTLKGDNGNTLIPFIESRYGIGAGIKVVDLQQSLQSQRTSMVMDKDFLPYYVAKFEKVEGEYYLMPRYFDFIFLNDDINRTFRSNRMVTDQGQILYGPDFTVMDDSVQLKYFKMLSRVYPEDGDYVGAPLYKYPSRNLIIAPFYSMDYILFFDLDNDTTFAIHQKGSLSFDDDLTPMVYTEMEGTREIIQTEPDHFAGYAGTDSFFMVMYCAGDYTINQPDPMNAAPELLFFDWEGNFLKSVMMDKGAGDLVYDEKTQTLYGIDYSNESILSFDLSSVVSDITNEYK